MLRLRPGLQVPRGQELVAFPRIGKVSVSEVTRADVLEILTPIWHTKGQTSSTVRLCIRVVREWAIDMDWRTDNPCDRLRSVLGPQSVERDRPGKGRVDGPATRMNADCRRAVVPWRSSMRRGSWATRRVQSCS